MQIVVGCALGHLATVRDETAVPVYSGHAGTSHCRDDFRTVCHCLRNPAGPAIQRSLSREGRDRLTYRGFLIDPHWAGPDCERQRIIVYRAQHGSGKGRGFRIEERAHFSDGRRQMSEPVQPFPSHRGIKIRKASDVAARLREALDEALADGVGHDRKDDRYSVRSPPEFIEARHRLQAIDWARSQPTLLQIAQSARGCRRRSATRSASYQLSSGRARRVTQG